MKSHIGCCWASDREWEQPAFSRAVGTSHNWLLIRWANLGEVLKQSCVKIHRRGSQVLQRPPCESLPKLCFIEGGGGQGLGPFQMKGLTYYSKYFIYNISLRYDPYSHFIDKEIEILRNYIISSELIECQSQDFWLPILWLFLECSRNPKNDDCSSQHLLYCQL